MCFRDGIQLNHMMVWSRGVFSHPRVTEFRGWHPWKGDNSKIEIYKICRFWQADSLHRSNWPCWVQIWPYFWARPTPSLSFWPFLSKTWKFSEKLVGQIVSQIRPWCGLGVEIWLLYFESGGWQLRHRWVDRYPMLSNSVWLEFASHRVNSEPIM